MAETDCLCQIGTETRKIKLEYFTEKEKCFISAFFGGEHLEVFENDYFAALKKLRILLEQKNALLLCNGCRINSYASGMAINMGLGLKIYILELGKHSKRSDLVNLFDAAEANQCGTVLEQEEFYKKWLSSIS